jgi:hypothetical protein
VRKRLTWLWPPHMRHTHFTCALIPIQTSACFAKVVAFLKTAVTLHCALTLGACKHCTPEGNECLMPTGSHTHTSVGAGAVVTSTTLTCPTRPLARLLTQAREWLASITARWVFSLLSMLVIAHFSVSCVARGDVRCTSYPPPQCSGGVFQAALRLVPAPLQPPAAVF